MLGLLVAFYHIKYVIGPPQPVLSLVGDDVILPCHLEPAMDAVAMTVEWTRPDLKPRFIHVWRDGPDRLIDHHQSYKRRTSLFVDKLRKGDVSLKLSNVRLSDEGKYRCYIPSLDKEAIIDLVVGKLTYPHCVCVFFSFFFFLSFMHSKNGFCAASSPCESKGWYPEPELFWLDAEGKLLSAGAPETVRGPDGLYTVSSRVTLYINSMRLCVLTLQMISSWTHLQLIVVVLLLISSLALLFSSFCVFALPFVFTNGDKTNLVSNNLFFLHVFLTFFSTQGQHCTAGLIFSCNTVSCFCFHTEAKTQQREKYAINSNEHEQLLKEIHGYLLDRKLEPERELKEIEKQWFLSKEKTKQL
uniref:Ig-like domain-containing protein n=1 Tax=Myripristis murdjan TaxID=586833 RepID=A0A667YUC9_9TELE